MKLQFIDPSSPILMDYIVTKGDSGKAAVFRYYTLFMYGYPLNCLQPKPDIIKYLFESQDGDESSRTFDQLYADQIINDKGSFFDFMTFMEALQNYDEVIIVSNYMHPNVYPILDSLMKLIQQRYGIRSYIINDIYDIDLFALSDFETEIGYQNYLRDVEWYLTMKQRG